MTSWFKGKILGRMRVSTAVLLVAFAALAWVHANFTPEPTPEAPAPAVVPPGFVPDPNYTWVPRTNVRRPKEPATTTETTTTTTTTETTSPTETTETTPSTTVVDPDGAGPLTPQTETLPSAPTSTTSVAVTPTPTPTSIPTPTPGR